MTSFSSRRRLHHGWWTLILFAVLAAFIFVTSAMFAGTFRSSVPVTLMSPRAGLVMEPGGKVKLRGVQVGRVSAITGGNGSASLNLEIDPDQVKYIPANVQARIRATTAFGAKYVDLIYPDNPSSQRLRAGTVIESQNVSTEVNTVFQNLVGVLHQVDPAKLNAVLTALSEGLRGQGPAIGEAVTDANQVLLAINPRSEAMRTDWHAVTAFSDTYGAAAQNILTVLDAASTTSTTISKNASDLDALLTNVIGFSRSGIALLGPSKDDFVNAINLAQPTTSLLKEYNPELTCLLMGSKWLVDVWPHNGRSNTADISMALGADPYRYPDNLPIIGAKGGPGGQPGCGSLPEVTKNWPVRALVTNTGWGTGVDIRPNPGIGHPFYADYLPATRANPQPPSLRGQGPQAPGPIPYPGAPPYGAPMYGPDGTPLWPGLPPAPPPGAPREPGPTPGSEPFMVPNPAQTQPTPGPPIPNPAVPAP